MRSHVRKHIKLISAALGLLIFISSIGIVVDIHRCGDQVVSIGLFAEAHECQGTCELVNNLEFDGLSISKASCCSDHQFYDKLDTQVPIDVDFTLVDGFDQDFELGKNAILLSNWDKSVFVEYLEKPPPISADLRTLYQVYLI